MDDIPVVLGMNRGQDGSICLMHGARVQWAIQAERLARRKHYRGGQDDVDAVYLPRLSGLDRPLDVLVECCAGNDAHADVSDHDGQAASPPDPPAPSLTFARGARRASISHHLAHVYSAFTPSPFREAAVMVIGALGSPVSALTEGWDGAAAVPGGWHEAASFYRADRERVTCIGKQACSPDPNRPAGLGQFYGLLTQALFPGVGNEGRVMDLAPYGDPRALGLPPLTVAGVTDDALANDGLAVHLPAPWQAALREHGRFRFGASGASFTDSANLAAAGQRAFEDALLALARGLHARTGLDALCFAGDAAQNCRANERLLREGPFRRLYVPPAPGNAGTALGCAIYGLTALAGHGCDFRWPHDYLGPAPQLADIEAALDGADDLAVELPRGRDALCARMLDLLCSGRVVGLYQGRSEFGPRALGHRSILADPRRERMRDWINARAKEREWFRPFAAVVAEERAADYFVLAAPSPFMGLAVPVRSSMMPLLSAVTHVDGTARLQTVGPSDDPVLRALLAGFEVRTGVPVLLNTSLNGRDEPIVETPQQAVAALRRMPLHGLAMPPYLVTKRHEPGLPA